MKTYFQNSISHLVITFIMISVLLSILFFYLSNQLMMAQNRINTQAFNMTLFLSQHNIITITPESLPANFLRTSYTHYSLAAYGVSPDVDELEGIKTKSDYLQKFDEIKESKIDKVNIAKEALTKSKDMLIRFYYATFIILTIIQIGNVLISMKVGRLTTEQKTN